MKQLTVKIVGKRSFTSKKGNEIDTIYFTYKDNNVNGLVCGSTMLIDKREEANKILVGTETTIIENEFKYYILT